MTVCFDNSESISSRRLKKPKANGLIEIGLVNNVSDAALQATERQFALLLKNGAGDIPFQLRCYSLPEVKRSPEAALRIKSRYASIDDLYRTNIDGLIVTGAEPGAPSLREEPYWRTLTEVIDWAEANTISSIWSCLAAHAAVLHLDGIERRRLSEKCSGIYDCSKVRDNWLTEDLPSSFKISHSRLNGLNESDVRASGYQVLTVSKDAGVDIFAKRQRSEFIFFQGHPEYETLTLQREYLRDIGRYLAGQQEIYPVAPAGYFDAPTIAALEAFRNRATAKRDPALIAILPKLFLQPSITSGPTVAATTIFRNWLAYLEERKDGLPLAG
jgi:homoserine O-succinyltransferase